MTLPANFTTSDLVASFQVNPVVGLPANLMEICCPTMEFIVLPFELWVKARLMGIGLDRSSWTGFLPPLPKVMLEIFTPLVGASSAIRVSCV